MSEKALTLKQWRMIKDLTQQEIADKIGVHVNTYAAWEQNPERIELQYCKKIAEALGEDLNSIFLAYGVNNMLIKSDG
jgi:DNA-binding XRE family transcriptional regulator